MSDEEIRGQSRSRAGEEVTYTCVPPGSGYRIGIDRDEDGVLDLDEVSAGTDPAGNFSRPQSVSDPA